MVSSIAAAKIKADSTHSLSGITNVPELLKQVGEGVCNRWIAIGAADTKIHWQYGAEAEALISEGARVGVTCKAIAIVTGKSFETIRKAYYTFIYYTPEHRVQFDACPYSIFQHARTQEKPLEVLQYYMDHKQTSVEEIEAIFPDTKGNEEFEKYFSSTKYPRYFYRICQEIYGIEPIWKQEADEHIQALVEIIERANK